MSDRPAARGQHWVVVGVTAQQPECVVRQAARFARQFEAGLVCAHVDRGSLSSYFGGSVAAQLAYRQHRPVVVIPRTADLPAVPPPWQRADS